MRKISVKKVQETVTELCLKANFELRPDILKALKAALRKETARRPRNILKSIVENAGIAKKERIAICQDTGLVSVYLEIGNSVKIKGDIVNAVNKGVKEAYRIGHLRKSVVTSPLDRKNTKTNAPCIVHTRHVAGERIKISVVPKGFGSENRCSIKMFYPTASWDEIKEFIAGV